MHPRRSRHFEREEPAVVGRQVRGRAHNVDVVNPGLGWENGGFVALPRTLRGWWRVEPPAARRAMICCREDRSAAWRWRDR
jgi:hypothetical protein